MSLYTVPQWRGPDDRAGDLGERSGAFDAWGVEPDPDRTIMGYVRYRSRRDRAELVCNPRFAGAHDFKFAAMPQTFSFPTQPMVLMLVNPAVTVGLVLALGAALMPVALAG